MELRQLRYFVAVARHGHVTRAAESLFVSQPALSQQIASLERELGTPLFDRVGRGMELTAAGRVLRDYAVRILDGVEDARAAVGDLLGTLRGDLTVATIQSANVTVLVEAVARFQAAHPGVIVRLREERADAVRDLVRRGEAVLGITYLGPDAEAGIESIPLYREELVLVVPADHPSAGGEIETGEIAGMPLVVPPGGYCLRKGVDAVLAEAGERQRVVAEITAIEGICAAVRAGVGVAILPERYITPRAEREGLGVVRLVEPVPARLVGVVRSLERHACAATRAFLADLEAVAGEPAPPTMAAVG